MEKGIEPAFLNIAPDGVFKARCIRSGFRAYRLSAKRIDRRGLAKWAFLVFEISHTFSGSAQFDLQCQQVSVYR